MENYEVKNLVVSVYIDNAMNYNEEADPLAYAMPPETTGRTLSPSTPNTFSWTPAIVWTSWRPWCRTPI